MFVAELYSFCLTIAYIARRRQSYIYRVYRLSENGFEGVLLIHIVENISTKMKGNSCSKYRTIVMMFQAQLHFSQLLPCQKLHTLAPIPLLSTFRKVEIAYTKMSFTVTLTRTLWKAHHNVFDYLETLNFHWLVWPSTQINLATNSFDFPVCMYNQRIKPLLLCKFTEQHYRCVVVTLRWYICSWLKKSIPTLAKYLSSSNHTNQKAHAGIMGMMSFDAFNIEIYNFKF